MSALGRRISTSRRIAGGLFAAVALPSLLAACANDKVRVADLRTPAAYEQPQPADTAPTAALENWWTLYNDAQLSDLVEQALKNSPDAKDALSKLAQAVQVRRAALDAYNPQGQLAGSASRSQFYFLNGGSASSLTELGGLGASLPTGAGAGSSAATGGASGGLTSGASGLGATNINSLLESESYSLGFNVSWEIDLFGRRASARRSADADLANARFTYDATRWSLAANVADSLFQARGLAIQLDQAEETLRIERRLYDISKARADHGLTPSSDAAQTESNVQSAEAQAESLRAQLAAARRQLLLLVGRGVDPLASLPVPATVGAPPPVPASTPGELLVRRPDVRAAHSRLDSALGKLSLNKKALLPTFSLQPGAGLLQEGSTSAGQLGFWSLAVGAAMPVLDRHRLLSVVHQQRETTEQAVIAYEKSVQTAYSDAEQAFGYYDSDKKRVAMLASAEKNAGFAYQAKQTGYARGLNDLNTALTAETQWRQTRLALAQAQVTLMQRSVQVFKALGGGWAPETRTVETATPQTGKTAG